MFGSNSHLILLQLGVLHFIGRQQLQQQSGCKLLQLVATAVVAWHGDEWGFLDDSCESGKKGGGSMLVNQVRNDRRVDEAETEESLCETSAFSSALYVAPDYLI